MGIFLWIGRHLIWSGAVAILVVVPVIVLVIRALTGPTVEQSQRLDPEGQWTRVIERLGISPVFPPEEDFAVGDLFVQVVSDDDPDPNALNRVKSSTPFRATAVKLDHVDVRKQLEDIYATLPFFGDLSSGSDPGLFRRPRTALPLAAFPGITVSDTQQAAAGLSWVGRVLFQFGASSENFEHLDLPTIETYGLPSVEAQAAVDHYCSAVETQTNCTEQTARKYLQAILGDRVFARYIDRRDLRPRYAITIRIFMVNRVYLARAIYNQVQFGRAEIGTAQLSVSEPATEPTTQIQAPPGGVGADTPGSLSELQKRIDDLEKRLSGLQQSAAGTYGSTFNRRLGMNETFARPVAIGFRYVSYETDPSRP
jgi:hypothetical protein